MAIRDEQQPPQPAAARISTGLSALRAKFLDELPHRILRLEGAMIALRNDVPDPDAAAQIKNDLHRLSGISATLGFEEIGRTAGSLEARLDALPAKQQSSAIVDDLASDLENLLEMMESSLP